MRPPQRGLVQVGLGEAIRAYSWLTGEPEVMRQSRYRRPETLLQTLPCHDACNVSGRFLNPDGSRILLCSGSNKHFFSFPEISADTDSKILPRRVVALVRSRARNEVDISMLREESKMQEGSVIREHRKLGPDVWSYRWWKSGPSGNKIHRRIVLGTAEQLRDISSARQTTAGLIREINAADIRMTGRSMTLAPLADHFQQRELGHSNSRISYSTKRAYQGYLNKWIVPRWGDYILRNIKAVEVKLWLKDLQRAAGTGSLASLCLVRAGDCYTGVPVLVSQSPG